MKTEKEVENMLIQVEGCRDQFLKELKDKQVQLKIITAKANGLRMALGYPMLSDK